MEVKIKDKLVRDSLGWIDDFRALPGKCGQPITQKIYLLALMNQGISTNKLKEMGFSKDIISEVFNMKLADIFNEDR